MIGRMPRLPALPTIRPAASAPFFYPSIPSPLYTPDASFHFISRQDSQTFAPVIV